MLAERLAAQQTLKEKLTAEGTINTALIHCKALIICMKMRRATIESAVTGKHETDELAFFGELAYLFMFL